MLTIDALAPKGYMSNYIKELRYTVQRARKDNTLYGPIHGSVNSNITMCGLDINENWWILCNNPDEATNYQRPKAINCKECLRKLIDAK